MFMKATGLLGQFRASTTDEDGRIYGMNMPRCIESETYRHCMKYKVESGVRVLDETASGDRDI